MIGLLGGIILMFILQFAVINVLSADVGSYKYQYFIFLPYVVLVFLAGSMLWLLERRSG